MSEGRILVVEDDNDTAEMLRIYFTNEGYSVNIARRGNEALEVTRLQIPDLIVLDINLPGMDGYTVCRELRTTTRTSHIPVIFLTERDERNDRLMGLELGADDYITKPFDLEELVLRVKNAINNHQRMNMTDPRTGLPASRLIEDQIRLLMKSSNWFYIEASIEHLQPFHDAYGFVASDEALRFTALLFNEVADEFGDPGDFLGHAGGQIFIYITSSGSLEIIENELRRRFEEGIKTHYNFLDSEQGGIYKPDGSLAPLMSLSIGVVSSKSRSFSDIREITEAAAVLRRLDRAATTA